MSGVSQPDRRRTFWPGHFAGISARSPPRPPARRCPASHRLSYQAGSNTNTTGQQLAAVTSPDTGLAVASVSMPCLMT